MKKENLFRTALIALLSASVLVACKDDNNEDDNNGGNAPEKVSPADYAVDLGLPSGTKWAKMNIGATNSCEGGEYFAWGEIKPKETYDWSTYKFVNNATVENGQEWKMINKYQIDDGYNGIWYSNVKFVGDGKTTLDPEDDAASVHWGGDWSTPSVDDFVELRTNCEIERVKDYNGTGVSGMIVKGNGNEMFIPFAGYRIFDACSDEKRVGPLWTNTLDASSSFYANDIYTLEYDPEKYHTYSWPRYWGACVRPICPANGNTNSHDAIDFGLPSGKLWATMNVGAEKVVDYGYYLAWGETEPKELYVNDTYKHVAQTDKGLSYNKYQIDDGEVGNIWYTKDFVGDGKETLESINDAAAANWGGNWRMPTKEQVQELLDGCYIEWTDNYDDNPNYIGYIVYKAKSDGDKGILINTESANAINKIEGYTLADTHIFLPSYIREETEDAHNNYLNFFYLTASLENTSNAVQVIPSSLGVWFDGVKRCEGVFVRPVYITK